MLTVLVFAAAGCGGGSDRKLAAEEPAASSTSSSGAPVAARAAGAVCEFLDGVQKAAKKAKDPKAGLRALALVQPRLHRIVESSDATDQAELAVIAAAADKAVTTQNLAPLASDKVAAAGADLAQRCR